MDQNKLAEILETNLLISKKIAEILSKKCDANLQWGRGVIGDNLLDLIDKSERILDGLKRDI